MTRIMGRIKSAMDGPPRLLIVILVASVLARAALALYLDNWVGTWPGAFDEKSYHVLAGRILDGFGFSFGQPWWTVYEANRDTAHWSFLYTLWVAGTYAVVGVIPVAIRLIQAVLVGIAHPLISYLLARELFGRRTGLMAAAITALYSYFIFYSVTLMTESFYFVTILAALYLAVRLSREEKVPKWKIIGFGLALGASVLLRQAFLLIVPVILLWLWIARKGKGWASGGSIAVALATIVVLILPFTLYNYLRFDRFVLLNTNAGYALYWANHPVHEADFVPILGAGDPSYSSLIPEELRSLEEDVLDRILLRRGLEFIAKEPARYLKLSVSRIPELFKFWPSASSSFESNVMRVLSFGITWPFMLAGAAIALWPGSGHWAARRGFWGWLGSAPTLLAGVAGAYALIHILVWALIRYRLPADAIMIVFAAFAAKEIAVLFGLISEPVRERAPIVGSESQA